MRRGKKLVDYYQSMPNEEFMRLLLGKEKQQKFHANDKPVITLRVALRVFKPNSGDGEWSSYWQKKSKPRPVGQDMYAKAFDVISHLAREQGADWDWRKVSVNEHLQNAALSFDAWLGDFTSVNANSGLPNEWHFLAHAIMVMILRKDENRSSI